MVDHRMGRSQGRGPLGVIAALLGVCLLAASPLLLYRSVASVTRSQQQVCATAVAGAHYCCHALKETGSQRAGRVQCTSSGWECGGWAPHTQVACIGQHSMFPPSRAASAAALRSCGLPSCTFEEASNKCHPNLLLQQLCFNMSLPCRTPAGAASVATVTGRRQGGARCSNLSDGCNQDAGQWAGRRLALGPGLAGVHQLAVLLLQAMPKTHALSTQQQVSVVDT
jgi:hypothetical protein